METFYRFIQERKYELLLFGLVQHLFIGIFLQDLRFYVSRIWAVNMLILGIASSGVLIERGKWKSYIGILLFLSVLALPICLPFFSDRLFFIQTVNVIYTIYFSFIFWHILSFLLRPSYINIDILIASTCGYLLLIEIATFVMQFLFFQNSTAFTNVSQGTPAATFTDMVYFCTIVLTTIGFGDIAPVTHSAKLAVSFFGIVGQLYSVVLIGILISKFSATQEVK